MKRTIISTLAVMLNIAAVAQNFTWMRGANTVSVTGTYGTLGIASSTNDPGGRHGSARWVDGSGNLWLFGGEGYTASNTLCWMNDLWKYNVTTNQWTWVAGPNTANTIGSYGTMGVAAPGNYPGAREFSMSWVDASGNFWMFGGDGFASNTTFGRLADLWKYDPTSGLWTWMKGFNTVDMNGVYGTLGVPATGNMPGSRFGSGAWADNSGNLWLWGGKGFPASGPDFFLNDLWKYNIATNQWTWVHGSSSSGQSGTYGTLSVPATTNFPGAKEFPSSWISSTGELYMFGGRGYSSTSFLGYTNDMWKYDPAANTWAWVSGASIPGQQGLYGTMGVPSVTNNPGGRYTAASWKDPSGNLWLFGGLGFATASSAGLLNDMFRFNPATNEWTWFKGNNTLNSGGIYGTLGVPAPANVPGARRYNVFWTGNNATLWLFGSEGYAASSAIQDNMNDMWKFSVPCNPDSVKAIPGSLLCTGSPATLTAFNQYSSSVVWYNVPNGGSSIGTGTTLTTPPLTAVNGPTVYNYYAQSNSCTMTPRTLASLTVNPVPQLTLTSPSPACSGVSSHTVSGALSYTWFSGPIGAVATVTLSAPSHTFIVLGKDANGCENTVTKTVTVYATPTITAASSSPNFICSGSTVALTANGGSTYAWTGGQTGSPVIVTPTVSTNGIVQYTVTGTSPEGCSSKAVVNQSVTICSGITQVRSASRVNIYPNPNKGLFNVTGAGEEKFRLYNLLGVLVFESSLSDGKNEMSFAGTSGVYIYEVISSGAAVSTGKMVIE